MLEAESVSGRPFWDVEAGANTKEPGKVAEFNLCPFISPGPPLKFQRNGRKWVAMSVRHNYGIPKPFRFWRGGTFQSKGPSGPLAPHPSWRVDLDRPHEIFGQLCRDAVVKRVPKRGLCRLALRGLGERESCLYDDRPIALRARIPGVRLRLDVPVWAHMKTKNVVWINLIQSRHYSLNALNRIRNSVREGRFLPVNFPKEVDYLRITITRVIARYLWSLR